MEFIKEYLEYLEIVKNRAKSTITVYESDLRLFNTYITNNLNKVINEILKKDIYEYIKYLTDINNSPRTRARKISSLREFYKWMYEQQYMSYSPMLGIESPSLGQPLPKYLTLEDSINLLEVSKKGMYWERNYCIITIFLNCGLRLSELCNINIEDIRSDKSICVHGKGDKDRIIFLNGSCITAINRWLEARKKIKLKDPDEPALFVSNRGVRISKKTVQGIVKDRLKEIGFDDYSTHKLRHTCATLMYQYGDTDLLTIKEVLGHANITTTQIYTHLGDEKVRMAIERNPLNGLE